MHCNAHGMPHANPYANPHGNPHGMQRQLSQSNFILTSFTHSTGAPWSTQAVVEWMTSVQLELLRSGRSKRMREQMSERAVDKVSSQDDSQQDGSSIAGNGHVAAGFTTKGRPN